MKKAYSFIVQKLAISTAALVIAVIMSGASMYCTANKVDVIENEIALLITEKEKNIRSLAERWEVNAVLNSRVDTAYLMSLIDKNAVETKRYLKSNIEKYAIDQNIESVDLKTLKLVSKDYERSLLNNIDEIYYQNIKLQKQMDQLQKKKSFYKSLAQTLQVLALAVALIFGRVSI